MRQEPSRIPFLPLVRQVHRVPLLPLVRQVRRAPFLPVRQAYQVTFPVLRADPFHPSCLFPQDHRCHAGVPRASRPFRVVQASEDEVLQAPFRAAGERREVPAFRVSPGVRAANDGHPPPLAQEAEAPRRVQVEAPPGRFRASSRADGARRWVPAGVGRVLSPSAAPARMSQKPATADTSFRQ